jgi:hypothetical protein
VVGGRGQAAQPRFDLLRSDSGKLGKRFAALGTAFLIFRFRKLLSPDKSRVASQQPEPVGAAPCRRFSTLRLFRGLIRIPD